MKKFYFSVATLALMALVTGCGNSGSSSTVTPTTSISGVAVDGYIMGATACIDLNSNMQCDSNEPNTTTATGGAFTFSNVLASYVNYPIVIFAGNGAVDEQRGTVFTSSKPLILAAPAGQTSIVNPFTTLVQQEIINGQSLTAAQNSVASLMGIPTTAIYSNFIADNNDSLRVKAYAMSDLIVADSGNVNNALNQVKNSGGGSSDSNNSNNGGNTPFSAIIPCVKTNIYQSDYQGTTPTATQMAQYAGTYNAKTGNFDDNFNFQPTGDATIVLNSNGSYTYNGTLVTPASVCYDNAHGEQITIYNSIPSSVGDFVPHLDFLPNSVVTGTAPTSTAQNMIIVKTVK